MKEKKLKQKILSWLLAGWKITQRHPWMITMLFLYQFFWGFVLYTFVKSIMLPLLHRYPGEYSESAVQLFLAEGQFQLLKTDISHSALWFLFGFVLLRMILSPLFSAGIYYSIHRDERVQIRPFIRGIQSFGVSFVFIYLIQTLCMLLPLYWVVPYISNLYAEQSSYPSLLLAVAPFIIGYGTYITLLKLWMMYIQFGKVSGASLLHAQFTFVRNLWSVLSLSSIMFAISALLALVSLSISMLWAGVLVIILHQLYYLGKTFMRIWEIGAQYQIWRSES